MLLDVFMNRFSDLLIQLMADKRMILLGMDDEVDLLKDKL